MGIHSPLYTPSSHPTGPTRVNPESEVFINPPSRGGIPANRRQGVDIRARYEKYTRLMQPKTLMCCR